MTMTMVRKKQLGTKYNDHNHSNGREEVAKNKKRTTMATTMAKRSTTKNTRR
jgi:hypothetical protein